MGETHLEGIKDLLVIDDRLATAGQPAREQFALIADAGFDKVINLATAESPGAILDEEEVVRQAGMAYRNIPVVWTQPTDKDLADFFAEMDASRGQKVFLHCALNMRVSAFLFLYRATVLGEEKDVAWERVLEIWQPDEVWQAFIDHQLDLSS